MGGQLRLYPLTETSPRRFRVRAGRNPRNSPLAIAERAESGVLGIRDIATIKLDYGLAVFSPRESDTTRWAHVLIALPASSQDVRADLSRAPIEPLAPDELSHRRMAWRTAVDMVLAMVFTIDTLGAAAPNDIAKSMHNTPSGELAPASNPVAVTPGTSRFLPAPQACCSRSTQPASRQTRYG
jgi:hypothetical protein